VAAAVEGISNIAKAITDNFKQKDVPFHHTAGESLSTD